MAISQRIKDATKVSGLLAILVMVGLLATACGTKTPSTSTRTPQLRVWRVGQDEDVVRDLVRDFKKDRQTLVVTYRNKNLEGYELSALKSLAARQGPDVWSIPDDWIGDHIARIQPLPATFYATDKNKDGQNPVERVKADYPAGIVEQIVSADGKSVYGLPTGVDSLQLYYNPDLLKAAYDEFRIAQGSNAKDEVLNPVRALLAKPPATWSDLTEQTKYLTKRDGTTVSRSAIALGTADNVPNAADIMQLLILQNGGKVVSSDRRNALFHIPETTPAGVSVRPGENALDFYTSFARPDKATYTWNPSMPQALDAFGQGKVAMVIAFSDFGRALKVKYPKLEFKNAAVPQISVAPLQEPVNLIRFNVEVVTKVAASTATSFEFLRGYAARSNANTLARAYSSFKLLSPFTETLENDKEEFLNKQVLTGKSVYKKNREQFDQAFRQMAIDVTQNGLTPDKALDSAAEKINVLLVQDEE